MFTRPASRLPALFALSLGLHVGFAAAQEGVSLSNSPDVLNAMPIQPASGFNFKIPEKPPGHILDTAHFLQPEMLQRLDSALLQESQAHGVDVYLLTVPSVKKDTFDPFTRRVADAWTKDCFGAVIVFDDGTGNVAIQPSEKVAKRFYEFELSALLKDTMSTKKRPRLSRDGLEHTAMSVRDALHELKMRANREERNSLITQAGLAVVVLLAALSGAFAYFRQRPVEKPEARVAATDNQET